MRLLPGANAPGARRLRRPRLAAILSCAFAAVSACGDATNPGEPGLSLTFTPSSAPPYTEVRIEGLPDGETADREIRVGGTTASLAFDADEVVHRFVMPSGLSSGPVEVEVPYGNGLVAIGSMTAMASVPLGGSKEAALERLDRRLDELQNGVQSTVMQLNAVSPDSRLSILLGEYGALIATLRGQLDTVSEEQSDAVAELYSANPTVFDGMGTDLLTILSTLPTAGATPQSRFATDAELQPLALCADMRNRLQAANDFAERVAWLNAISVAVGGLSLPLKLVVLPLVTIATIPALTIQNYLEEAPYLLQPDGLHVDVGPARVNHLSTTNVNLYVERTSMDAAADVPGLGSVVEEVAFLVGLRIELLKAVNKLKQGAASVTLELVVRALTALVVETSTNVLWDNLPPISPILFQHVQLHATEGPWRFIDGPDDFIRRVATERLDTSSFVVRFEARAEGLYPECSASTSSADQNPNEGLNGFVILGPGSITRIDALPGNLTLRAGEERQVAVVAYTDAGAIATPFDLAFAPPGIATVTSFFEHAAHETEYSVRGVSTGISELLVRVRGQPDVPTAAVQIEVKNDLTGTWRARAEGGSGEMTITQVGNGITGTGTANFYGTVQGTVVGTVTGDNVELLFSAPGYLPSVFVGQVVSSTRIEGTINGSGFNNDDMVFEKIGSN